MDDSSVDQVPDPSTWVPLKLKTNQQSSSDWTAVYQAEINHQHPDLIKKLYSIPPNFLPISRPPQSNDQSSTNNEFRNLIVVKQVSPHLRRPPHDTLTEIKILTSLNHPNIVSVLAHREPPKYPNYCLFLPLYPTTLYDVLNDQNNYLSPAKYEDFDVLVRRIIRDIGSGLVFLHSHSIAHRDINPSNVALTDLAHGVLIDFGTAWPGHPSPESNTLEFELGTMPYRAPELLFGSRSYSPFSIDIWSFGALIAEFYMPMVPMNPEEDENEEEGRSTPNNNVESNPTTALDWYCSSNPATPWSTLTNEKHTNLFVPLVRKTLFEGSFGDIGLAGSIFKILGTPNSTTWPEAKQLPDFSKLNFHQFEKQNLQDLLPLLNFKVDLLEEKLKQKKICNIHLLSEEEQEEDKEQMDNNLNEQIEIEKNQIKEKIKLIDSFLNYSSFVRLNSFENIFSLSKDNPSECGINHWLFGSIKDEDQICFEVMKLFF